MGARRRRKRATFTATARRCQASLSSAAPTSKGRCERRLATLSTSDTARAWQWGLVTRSSAKPVVA